MKRKRKRKRSPWEWLCIFGVPQTLTAVGIGIYTKVEWCRKVENKAFDITGIYDLKIILMIAGFFWLCVVLRNTMWLKSKRKIGFLTFVDKYEYEPPEPDDSPRKKRAQYPEVDNEYLSDVPDQMPLGKVGGKYLQFDLKKCLSLLIFGSPGAGKTTLILTMLQNMRYKIPPSRKKPALFVFDFKEGEMYHKSCMPDDESATFVSLEGRDAWGWNIYYRLSENSTDDDVIRELKLIADVLIDSGNEKNAFFTETAKTWIIFIGLYDFRQGKSFIETMDHITGGDSKTMLRDVYDQVKDQPTYKKVKDALAEYVVIDDTNEALQDIRMTLKQKTSVFKVDDIRWALEYNPKKASPYDLEEGKSVFFYPGDTDVTVVVLKIIARQLEYHCCHRDYLRMSGKGGLRRIIAVCDECFSIGNVVDFAKWTSVARAYRTSLIMIWQSYSQIKSTFDSDYAESLMDDVAGIAILAVNSPSNAEQFVNFAGEYIEEKRSVNQGGKSDGSSSKSFEYRPVLTKKDFLQLKKNKQVIVFMDGNYFKCSSEPARYYAIPDLKKISNQCLKAHRQIQKNKKKQEV